MTKPENRAYRLACLILADRALRDAMGSARKCPRTADKIKEAELLLDDALALSEKDQ